MLTVLTQKPPGIFARAYEAKRKTTIERTIDADPVAAAVREIVADCSLWTGSAADFWAACTYFNGISGHGSGGPKNARALARRLRRAETFLRVPGIDIAF
jgi:hypothetical protein